MRKLAALVLICGCQGEQVSSLASDSAIDPARESGTCEALTDNLIPDGSFEETLGTKWRPTLEIVTGGADHCQRWAKMITREPWAGVTIKLPLTGEKGDVYEFGASIERLDDSSSGSVMVSLQNDDALLQESPVPP